MEERTNVVLNVKDNVLTITVDLSQDHGLSSSGKSKIVGSTHGFTKLVGTPDVSVSLNVIRKVGK
jgi:hypothetical protein